MGLSRPSGEPLRSESLEQLEPASWSPLGPWACEMPFAQLTVTADWPSDDIRLDFLGCEAAREVNV